MPHTGATKGAYGATTITSSATLIRASQARTSISIYNNGAATVYVGTDSAVTTSNGMPIPAGSEREILFEGTIYGIVASGSVEVRWIEEGY